MKRQKKNLRWSSRSGFTLIELLVVISVLTFMASLMASAINQARRASRDVKRVADLKQMQKAMDAYIIDKGVYPRCYPPGDPQFNQAIQVCGSPVGFLSSGRAHPLTNVDLLNYLEKIPADPLNIPNQNGYFYLRGFKKTSVCPAPGVVFGGGLLCRTGRNTDYILAAVLETRSNYPESFPPVSMFAGTVVMNYLVGNLD